MLCFADQGEIWERVQGMLQGLYATQLKLGIAHLFNYIFEFSSYFYFPPEKSDLCSTLYRVQMVPRHTDAFQEDRSLPDLQ